MPFTPAQARAARAAFRDIGWGSGHPAGLNLGDCFAYTTAQDLGEALLFTGDHSPPTPTCGEPAERRAGGDSGHGGGVRRG
ncbi:hypothetical protein [Kytococcus schroeteri]|uniref:hypothetical protein n=1 Tax=Kytococcus schroeteri TaxID=138300 RepID=UPI0039C2D4ED